MRIGLLQSGVHFLHMRHSLLQSGVHFLPMRHSLLKDGVQSRRLPLRYPRTTTLLQSRRHTGRSSVADIASRILAGGPTGAARRLALLQSTLGMRHRKCGYATEQASLHIAQRLWSSASTRF